MAPLVMYHDSYLPHLQVVVPSVCRSTRYDGQLVNMYVASFTATLYQGGLPTILLHPAWLRAGQLGYRHVTTFEPDDYVKFFMDGGGLQVSFLMVPRHNWQLVNQLRARFPGKDDPERWSAYFPHGQPNDYYTSRVFVNVHFLSDIAVNYVKSVPKSDWAKR